MLIDVLDDRPDALLGLVDCHAGVDEPERISKDSRRAARKKRDQHDVQRRKSLDFKSRAQNVLPHPVTEEVRPIRRDSPNKCSVQPSVEATDTFVLDELLQQLERRPLLHRCVAG